METRKTKVSVLGRALLLHLMSYGVREMVLYTIAFLPLGTARPYIVWTVTALSAMAVYFLPVLYYLKWSGGAPANIVRPVNGAMGGGRLSVIELGFAAAATLCAVNLGGMFTDAATELLKLPPTETGRMPDGIGLQILTFISGVLIAPFMEELLFRGAVLNALAPFGRRTAVLISGALFALMHYSLYAVPYAFCAGCVIAFFAFRANSLLVAVGLHFLNNLITFIILDVEKYTGADTANTVGVVAFIVCAAVLVITAVIIMAKGGFKHLIGADIDRGDVKREGSVADIFCPELTVYVALAVFLCVCGIL